MWAISVRNPSCSGSHETFAFPLSEGRQCPKTTEQKWRLSNLVSAHNACTRYKNNGVSNTSHVERKPWWVSLVYYRTVV